MAQNLNRTRLLALKPQEKPYKVTDGGGLFLEVLPSGSMIWRYQYLLGGKREKVTIGAYRDAGDAQTRIGITLEAARDKHAEYKRLVRAGESPAKTKQAGKRASVVEKERAGNFEELAERWFTAEVAHKSEGWQTGVRNWFKLDIYPALGKRDPRTIGEFHIRQMLDKIEQRGSPASANKVRAIVRHIFAYAKRKGEVSVNRTTEIEPVAHRDRKSHRALGVKEIGPFLKALDRDRGREGNKLAIRLLMLTFVRKDELRQAKWTEVDFDNKVWEIPAHRMKMSDPHRVYLSRQAIEQLDSLRELSHGSEYVLPHFSTLSRSIGQTTINNVIDRLDIQGARFVPHGFRATASTILNEKGFRPEVIERSLAHKERNKVRGIYNQAEYAQERAAMAQWWADYVDALEAGGNVIPMNFKTAA